MRQLRFVTRQFVGSSIHTDDVWRLRRMYEHTHRANEPTTENCSDIQLCLMPSSLSLPLVISCLKTLQQAFGVPPFFVY